MNRLLLHAIFSQEVREKIVVDELIQHALNKCGFELKTNAYRRGCTENNEFRILIFVENSESFTFLYRCSILCKKSKTVTRV
jgi:hypothetical protein